MKKWHFTLFILSAGILFLNFRQRNETRRHLVNGQQTGRKYIVEGTISGANNDWMMICYNDQPKNKKDLDSAKISDGKFTFSGECETPRPFIIGMRHIENNGKRTYILYHGPFILDSGKLVLECKKDLTAIVARGTKGQDEFNTFKQTVAPEEDMMNKTRGELNVANPSQTFTDSINKVVHATEDKMTGKIIAHVKAHPVSIVSAYITLHFLPVANMAAVKQLYSLFTPQVKDSEYGKTLLEKVNAVKRTDVGQMAPDFNLPDKNNAITHLKSFKGKWTLVDIWASWCQPCRKENPNLIRAYAAFKGKGFEIVGVSVDKDKKAWLAAVKKDGLTWTQLLDTKSDVSTLYGINAVPMNYLLDKDGKIVDSDLRGSDLIEKLKEIIK